MAREGLVHYLNDGLNTGRPFTLIAAPAGYGKSTLAAEWTRKTGRRVAWLSLDEADDDPLRFFLYFLTAIRQVFPALGNDLFPVLQSGQLPPAEVLIPSLLNDLIKVEPPFLCVLDDFQVIQDALILRVFENLMSHQLRSFHLVIVTREDPPLPLARLRARNQLTEVRANDLRFRQDEIKRFLERMMGFSLPEKEVARLEDRTEGWIAGLQLAAIAMKSSQSAGINADYSAFIESLSGSHRYFLSYLTEEVLKNQPQPVREFLLQTSILDKLTGRLCDAVTGRDGSSILLENLLSENLFLIPLDDEQQWYRYHHLFSDLLRHQLKRTDPLLEPGLHLRASHWYESNHMPVEAVDHALAAGDHARVIRLLEVDIWQLLNHGFARRVEGWMRSLPAAWRSYSPRISLGFAWMYLLRGNIGQVFPFLTQAENALATANLDDENRTAMKAECLALRANLMQVQGNIDEAIEAGLGALRQARAENDKVNGLAYLGLGGAYRQAADFEKASDALQNAFRTSRSSGDLVTGMLAVTHFILMCLHHGRLRLAGEMGSQAFAWLERSGVAAPPVAGAVYGAFGLVLYEWNRVEEAREYYQRGIQFGTFSGHTISSIYSQVNLARLLQAEGNLESASRTLSDAMQLFQDGAPGWVRPDLIVAQVRLSLAENNPVAAESVLRQSGISAQDALTHKTMGIHLAYLRFLCHQRQDEFRQQGLSLAERIIVQAEEKTLNGYLIQVLVLGALAHSEYGNPATGAAWMERALGLAEPEGYLRVFLDEGEPAAVLLRRLTFTPYIRKLLALFPPVQHKGEQLPSSQEWVEPLTGRELDVLRLLAQGLKYAEIAGTLVISVNTVRFHVKRIYNKLGVEKLANAIEQARKLGLID